MTLKQKSTYSRQLLILIIQIIIDTMIEKVEIIVMKDQFMKLQYNT